MDPGEVEGTDLRVLKYPHPALRAENAEIESFDEDLKKLANDMFKARNRGNFLCAFFGHVMSVSSSLDLEWCCIIESRLPG